MFPGMRGGGLDPRKMQQMMKQMGIETQEFDKVEEVIIKLEDKELYFTNPDVTLMDIKGQKTYQVIGEPEELKREFEPDDEDVELVMDQSGCSNEEAIEALKESDGDIADAIMLVQEE